MIHEHRVPDLIAVIAFFKAQALESKAHFLLTVSKHGSDIVIRLDDDGDGDVRTQHAISTLRGLYDLYW